MSQEQETSPGGICPTSFSVINHGSCVTQRGLGRQMGTRDTTAETTDKSLGLAKLSSTFLSNGFKILTQPTASAAKFGLKKACYSAEVIPGPGQGHQACVNKGRTQDIGFGHIIVCRTLPTTGHHLTTAKIDRMETKSPKKQQQIRILIAIERSGCGTIQTPPAREQDSTADAFFLWNYYEWTLKTSSKPRSTVTTGQNTLPPLSSTQLSTQPEPPPPCDPHIPAQV